jgi:hypothetical protein
MLKVRNDGAVNNGGEPGEQRHQRRRSQQRCTREHQRESVSPAETTPSSATPAPEPGADRADRGRDMDKNVKVGTLQRSTEALLQLNASATGSYQWWQYPGGISRVTFTILEQDPTKEARQVEAFLSGNGGSVSSAWLSLSTILFPRSANSVVAR